MLHWCATQSCSFACGVQPLLEEEKYLAGSAVQGCVCGCDPALCSDVGMLLRGQQEAVLDMCCKV